MKHKFCTLLTTEWRSEIFWAIWYPRKANTRTIHFYFCYNSCRVSPESHFHCQRVTSYLTNRHVDRTSAIFVVKIKKDNITKANKTWKRCKRCVCTLVNYARIRREIIFKLKRECIGNYSSDHYQILPGIISNVTSIHCLHSIHIRMWDIVGAYPLTV